MKRIWFVLLWLLPAFVFAAHPVVHLTVAYQTVNFAHKKMRAIAVNQQIPAPVLHFKEGDHVTLYVTNHLDKETAVHWHGLLVPWQMDGVKGVSQQGIQPGETFKYEFTLHQSGTYWYHAHAGLQEQSGLYGALVIDPKTPPAYRYNKDFTIVLSDWINTNPDQVEANLKKSGDYYAPNFPLQASLMRFIRDYSRADKAERKIILGEYLSMQQTRMGLYDFSDVAYDAFLLNGTTRANAWRGLVKAGDVVRLRFIGAGAGTIFNVKVPRQQMEMVHVQGNDVKPYLVNDFRISPGETYDVLVKIKDNQPVIIYAESIDTLGAAVGALVTEPAQAVNYAAVRPFPTPQPVMRKMMQLMMGSTTDMPDMSMMDMSHENHDMQMAIEPAQYGDHLVKPESDEYTTTLDTKYKNIIAAVPTNNPDKPIAAVINLELYGYMGRYIWMINGLPEDKAPPIVLQPAKRYRLVFTNNSMMSHPMHLHGHWFIMRKGAGAYDPLLHTIEVQPGATITADVDTDASGQWIFHCHLLYHMASGMTRYIQYSTLLELAKAQIKPEHEIARSGFYNRPIVRVDEVRPLDLHLIHHPMAHEMQYWFMNMVELGVNPFTQSGDLTFKGLYGRDYNKLELQVKDAELIQGKIDNADMDIFYWHLVSQYWSIKGGVNYFYRPALTPYWQPGIGIEGLMPYFIETDVRGYYKDGSAKLDAEFTRDTQITNNFFISLSVRGILASKTVVSAQLGSGLNQMQYTVQPYYRVMPGFNIFIQYEYEKYYGAFKNMQMISGDSNSQNVVTAGISALF